MATWDPSTYLRHADERSRPFAELIARVDAEATTVVDLGCGPGHLMPLLRERWPSARLHGVDSSADMLGTATQEHAGDGITYEQADVREWAPAKPVDVIVTNATLQWVPEHLPLVTSWQSHTRRTLALSVPGNHRESSHVLLREYTGRLPYSEYTAEVEHPAAHDAKTYLEALAAPGWRVDAWETTYLHVLRGADPVLSWISGTGARPVLQALPDALRERFRAEYGAALREAYPVQSYGTVLPFRRVFAVATRA